MSYLDELKTIEHSTLKVPYESLNKQYRNVQKSIDRDCSSLNQAMLGLEKLTKNGGESVNRSDLIASFTSLVDKLKAMKKRTSEFKAEEDELFELMSKRVDHLKDCHSASLSVVKSFRKSRVDRTLIDYFLRSGYYQSAQLLAEKANIQFMTNVDIFLNEKDIIESLKNKDTAKCLAWCNENKSKLKKINSNLEFALRQQEFIELVRSQKCVEAVHHARKHFVNLTPSQLVDVQKSMVLLAYVKSADIQSYQELLSDSRWGYLIDLFRQENFKIHQIPDQSSFISILQAGLSALKTPTCYKKVTAVKNPNCPVCHPNLNVIARPLPYAYCSNSKLICSYSGEPINEHNLPMMLPNGYVYGYNSLLKLMSENNGKIKCPRTDEIYDFSEAQKVFIL